MQVQVQAQSPYLVVMSIFFKVPGPTQKSKSLANHEAKFKSTGQERKMGAGICEGVADAVVDVVPCVCDGSLSPKTSAAMLSDLFSQHACSFCVR